MNYCTFIKQIKLLTQNKHVFLHSKVYSTLKSNMQTSKKKNCIMNIRFIYVCFFPSFSFKQTHTQYTFITYWLLAVDETLKSFSLSPIYAYTQRIYVFNIILLF